MIRKRTIIFAAIVGCLFLLLAGRCAPILAPATIGWFITVFGGSAKHCRDTQIRCGVIGALLLGVQFLIMPVILTVIWFDSEQAGEDAALNLSALAIIGMFAAYAIWLVAYFGSIVRTRSNKTRGCVKTLGGD